MPADLTPEETIREHPAAESDPLVTGKAKKIKKDGKGSAKQSSGDDNTSRGPEQRVGAGDKVVTPAKKPGGKAEVISSEVVFKGAVFNVTRDQVTEPGGVRAQREVVRHHGSVVILAVDKGKSKRNPNILLIRQYRHAAGQFLLELPAGRIEPGEKLIPAAKRELIEETGYRAKKWSKHVTYFASPGFLSEAMNILLAEDLTLGEAQPEEDERIELHMTPLKDVLRMIHDGEIQDGKTLIGVLYYASLLK
jgi:ADP-ribose pyrophosphatase